MYPLLKKEIKENEFKVKYFEVFRVFSPNTKYNLDDDFECKELNKQLTFETLHISGLDYEEIHTFSDGSILVKIWGHFEQDKDDWTYEYNNFLNHRGNLLSYMYEEFGFIPTLYTTYNSLKEIFDDYNLSLTVNYNKYMTTLNIENIVGCSKLFEIVTLATFKDSIKFFDGKYYIIKEKSTVKEILDALLKENPIDFEHWYDYTFDTDIAIDEEDLKNGVISEEDIEMNQFDFIYSINDDYVWHICNVLKIDTQKEQVFVEELYEEVKDYFWEKLNKEIV